MIEDPNVPTFSEWVTFVFDHQASEDDQPSIPDEVGTARDRLTNSPAKMIEYVTRLFENPDELVERFSPDQIAAGLVYIGASGESDYMRELGNPALPWESRNRCIRSISHMFERIFVRLLPGQAARAECVQKSLERLWSTCFMWWDRFPGVVRIDRERDQIDRAIIATMAVILGLPSEACIQSALHGLGHWYDDSGQTRAIIDDFLGRNPDLHPPLRQYALEARQGNVQ